MSPWKFKGGVRMGKEQGSHRSHKNWYAVFRWPKPGQCLQAFPGPPFCRLRGALEVPTDSSLSEWGALKTEWLYSYLPRSILLELKPKQNTELSGFYMSPPWQPPDCSFLLLQTHSRKGILYCTLLYTCMHTCIYKTEQKFHKTVSFLIVYGLLWYFLLSLVRFYFPGRKY